MIGKRVSYLSYGVRRTAIVTGQSRDGEILFLNNGRWIFPISATFIDTAATVESDAADLGLGDNQ